MSMLGGYGSRGHNPYGAPLQPRFHPWITGPIELVTPSQGLAVTLPEARAYLRWDVDDTSQDNQLTDMLTTAQLMCEQEISGHRQFLTATYNLPVSHWFWGSVLKLPRPPLRQVNQVTYWDTNGNQQTLATSYYLTQTPWRMPGQIERAPFQIFPPHQADRHFPIYIQFTAGYASLFTVSGSTLTVNTTTFTNGQIVQVSCSTDGALPGGLAAQTNYYVVNVSGNTFQLSATSGGTAITLTGTSTGNLFIGQQAMPATIRRAILMLVAHWDENRSAVLTGTISKEVEFAVKALLDSEGYGSYA